MGRTGGVLEREHLHPVEGVDGVVDLAVAERNQQPIRHEVDVLAHQLTAGTTMQITIGCEWSHTMPLQHSGAENEAGVVWPGADNLPSNVAGYEFSASLAQNTPVHADEASWERVADELALDGDSVDDDLHYPLVGQLVSHQPAIQSGTTVRKLHPSIQIVSGTVPAARLGLTAVLHQS
jgi:hypothetical protein